MTNKEKLICGGTLLLLTVLCWLPLINAFYMNLIIKDFSEFDEDVREVYKQWWRYLVRAWQAVWSGE